MRKELDEIVRLTDDSTQSHVARMVSIKREAKAALVLLDASERPSNPLSQVNTGKQPVESEKLEQTKPAPAATMVATSTVKPGASGSAKV